MKIIENKIKCLKCGDIIKSCFTHDFQRCNCKAVGIDGGHEYLKRVGKQEDIEDMSISEYEIGDVLEIVNESSESTKFLLIKSGNSYGALRITGENNDEVFQMFSYDNTLQKVVDNIISWVGKIENVEEFEC